MKRREEERDSNPNKCSEKQRILNGIIVIVIAVITRGCVFPEVVPKLFTLLKWCLAKKQITRASYFSREASFQCVSAFGRLMCMLHISLLTY